VLAAGLFEVHLDTALPVLVEVSVRDDVVVLDRLFDRSRQLAFLRSDVMLLRSMRKAQGMCRSLTISTADNHNNKLDMRGIVVGVVAT
jgi:hypothetical protein